MTLLDKSLIFRSVNESDINELFTLLTSLSNESKSFFHPHSFDRNTVTNICCQKKEYYYVLEYQSKIIGYSMLRLFSYKIPSFGCCIHPSYEGKGYGEFLVTQTLDQAKKMKYPKVILKVHKNNHSAYDMYVKLGFHIIKQENDYIHMAITLD